MHSLTAYGVEWVLPQVSSTMFGVLNLCFVAGFPKKVCKRCQENVSSRLSQRHQSASSLGLKMEVSVVPS